ncbi:MAG TPA: hypothetical protein VKE96_34260, partial [Vicinamibacterales bacterium]|nr:hypothetical protein [Vicinamibacterales bacterium]
RSLHMRDAFVLRLSRESEPVLQEFTGWIEEVDTGRERHFRSTEELLAFLADCLTTPPDNGRKPNGRGDEGP